MNYTEVNYSGLWPATKSLILATDAPTYAVSAVDQDWTVSCYLSNALATGITAIYLALQGLDVSGNQTELLLGPNFISGVWGRLSFTGTLVNPGTRFARLVIATNSIIGGTTVNFTFRVGEPQLEPGLIATAPIVTNGGNFYAAHALTQGPSRIVLSENNTFVDPDVFRTPVASLRTVVNFTVTKYNNTNTFFAPTIVSVPVNLQPSLLINANIIRTVTITKKNSITVPKYNNTNTFYVEILRSIYRLTVSRYINTGTFFSPTVGKTAYPLAVSLYVNTNTFHTATITRGQSPLAVVQSSPFVNINIFYSPNISPANLFATRYINTNVFFVPFALNLQAGQRGLAQTTKYTNTSTIYIPRISPLRFIAPLYVNTNIFYLPFLTAFAGTRQFVQNTKFNNTTTFYSPTIRGAVVSLIAPLVTNTNTFRTIILAHVSRLTAARAINNSIFYAENLRRVLSPSLYTNASFFFASSNLRRVLGVSRYSNTIIFYPETISTTRALQVSRYVNTTIFRVATVAASVRNFIVPKYNNTTLFFTTIVAGRRQLIAASLVNVNTFRTDTISSRSSLVVAKFNSTNTFFAETVRATKQLVVAKYTNTNTFFSPVISSRRALTAALLTNTNTFYSAVVARPGVRNLVVAKYNNANTFYSSILVESRHLIASRYINTNTIYSHVLNSGSAHLVAVKYNNTNIFYSLSTAKQNQVVAAKYTNTNTFYTHHVNAGANDLELVYAPGVLFPPRRFYQASIQYSLQSLTQDTAVANDNTFFPTQYLQLGDVTNNVIVDTPVRSVAA